MNVPHGMNLRMARRLWRECGGTIEDKDGTGEEVFRHPRFDRPITVNKRRHDAPRKLTATLRYVAS
ncbi:MAG: hypothetical protein ACLQNE_46060 [Thermoguttaceae bacterium]